MASEPMYTVFDSSLPDYINFLLCPEISDLLDLQINVGTDELHKEKIGAMKWMLIARSKVLRVMLLESKIKTSKEFNISDLEPSTFRQFLTYVYGHHKVDSLQFGDAVRLLSAAEKYEVLDLKSQLADFITPQVTVENVPIILDHGLVCETVPPLWAEATRVIQTETQFLLENPKFLTLKPEAVVHILQQDLLSVEEVEVWRASLKWARHQLISAEELVSADAMRATMLPLLKYTRLCTLSYEELCKDVIPKHLLTIEEIQLICSSVNKGLKEAGLTSICNAIETRNAVVSKVLRIKMASQCPRFVHVNGSNHSKYVIQTTNKVRQMSFVLIPKAPCDKGRLKCHVTVKISKVTDRIVNTSSEAARIIEFHEQAPYGQLELDIPLKDDWGHVELLPNTQYVVWIDISPHHPTWVDSSNESSLLASNQDLVLRAVKYESYNGVRNQLKMIKYFT